MSINWPSTRGLPGPPGPPGEDSQVPGPRGNFFFGGVGNADELPAINGDGVKDGDSCIVVNLGQWWTVESGVWAPVASIIGPPGVSTTPGPQGARGSLFFGIVGHVSELPTINGDGVKTGDYCMVYDDGGFYRVEGSDWIKIDTIKSNHLPEDVIAIIDPTYLLSASDLGKTIDVQATCVLSIPDGLAFGFHCKLLKSTVESITVQKATGSNVKINGQVLDSGSVSLAVNATSLELLDTQGPIFELIHRGSNLYALG